MCTTTVTMFWTQAVQNMAGNINSHCCHESRSKSLKLVHMFQLNGGNDHDKFGIFWRFCPDQFNSGKHQSVYLICILKSQRQSMYQRKIQFCLGLSSPHQKFQTTDLPENGTEFDLDKLQQICSFKHTGKKSLGYDSQSGDQKDGNQWTVKVQPQPQQQSTSLTLENSLLQSCHLNAACYSCHLKAVCHSSVTSQQSVTESITVLSSQSSLLQLSPQRSLSQCCHLKAVCYRVWYSSVTSSCYNCHLNAV